MALLGFDDLKSLALPSLWDAGELEKIRLQDGTTLEQVTADIRTGMAALNGTLLSMPHYADLLAIQNDATVRYPIGVSNGFEEATEYGVPTPQRAQTTGHMVPLKGYNRALGWTQMYLRKANLADLDAGVQSAVRDARSLWQQTLLTRLFKVEGETVGTTSNASVPLVDAAATDTAYVPPVSPEGEEFASSHTHFLRHAAINDSNLAIAVEHLQEHGHQAPFDVCGARADAATWGALTGYKNPDWLGIAYHSSAVERAAISDQSVWMGFVETDFGMVRVWLTPRVPTNYYSVFKAYGGGDPRNPLRVRIDSNVGFGFNVVPGNYVNAPLQMVVTYTEFGVGIGEDRTNGVCVYIHDDNAYVTPTIS